MKSKMNFSHIMQLELQKKQPYIKINLDKNYILNSIREDQTTVPRQGSKSKSHIHSIQVTERRASSY